MCQNPTSYSRVFLRPSQHIEGLQHQTAQAGCFVSTSASRRRHASACRLASIFKWRSRAAACSRSRRARFGLSGNSALSPLLGELLCSRAKGACGSKRLRPGGPCSVRTEPAHQFGSDAPLSASDARQQRHVLVTAESSKPAVDVPSRRLFRDLRRAFRRCGNQIGIDSHDVDKAIKLRRELA